MAFTIDFLDKTVFGNLRVNVMSCSVDASSGNIDTGLSVIHGHSLAPISMASSAILMKRNIGSGATARPGILNIGAAASGDVFCLVVYGS